MAQMSESSTRPRPIGVETQLRAMANATDRANKPTGLLALGLVVALGFGLYALASWKSWSGARAGFVLAEANSATVDSKILEYNNIKAQTPDMNKLFPTLASMGSDIEKAARKVWGVAENQPIPGVIVNPKREGTLYDPAVSKALKLQTIEATIADQPLEKVMAWLAEVEGSKFLGPTFVSSLTLNPANAGWQGSVRFSTYERKQP
jgi:hypothetical protein